MKERIMILGAGVMQGPAIRIAKEMGLYTVVVDADDGAPAVSLADRFEKIDLKDKEGITALGASLKAEGGLGGIMTAGTDFSASVAWAAEKLGLPGIPYEAALNASDKERMRSCFRKARIPSPDFTVLREIPPESGPLPSYPVVVKPVDNMGGRGCRRADNFAGLQSCVEEALRFSRSGRAIVESFMDGPEFSVDAIVYHGEISICGLADRHIFFPPYFIEMGHTMPTLIGPEEQRALLETFCAAVRSLGIAGEDCCGAAKGDIKLSSSGPMIGEVAARLSGGYMSGWTYPYASGVDPARGAILAALGRRPAGLEARLSWTSAERAFISIPGKVRSIQGAEAALKRPHIRDLFLRAGPGKTVRFPENNVGKCGNIISAAADRESAVAAAEDAARSILIRLEAPNRETASFLAGSGPFPPDAFTLSAGLRSLLAQVPDPEPVSAAPMPRSSLEAWILPFPEFADSRRRDYAGRSVAESLEAVQDLTGCSLKFAPPEEIPEGKIFLGRRFWAALVRGGYQGAAYLVDTIIGSM